MISAADDVVALVEKLKLGLGARVTDRAGDIEEEDYRRIRKILLEHPLLSGVIPEFLRKCRTPDEVWRYITSPETSLPDASGAWASRREYLAMAFNPLLDALEGQTVETVGHFRLVEPIGRGGFGQVYRYRHELIGQEFAFKFFDPAFAAGGEHGFLERFFREARILFQLRHPNVIQIYDVGLLDRRPYIRMEYFPGMDLNRLLRKHGRVAVKRASNIVEEITVGLAYAHDQGVLHRDLKPANIMIAKPRQLRIIDFGLGAYIEQDLYSRLTKTGEAALGGHYTAPELLHDPKLIDRRSDIYSVGAIWYELVTGRRPAGAAITQILRDTEGVSAKLANVILRCLAEIGERYDDAHSLLADLRSLPEPDG